VESHSVPPWLYDAKALPLGVCSSELRDAINIQDHRKKETALSIPSVKNRSAWGDRFYYIAKTSVFTDIPADGKIGSLRGK
jgi:hypothetical protein